MTTSAVPLSMGAPGAPVTADRPTDDEDFRVHHVEPLLREVLAEEQARWKEHDAPWSDPVEALGAFLTGGKALRPRFLYWVTALSPTTAARPRWPPPVPHWNCCTRSPSSTTI
ncbi:MAG TPA: hypothetical protein VGN37_27155 [Actinocatenispora sp.]